MSDDIEPSTTLVRHQGRDRTVRFVGTAWLAVDDDDALPADWERGTGSKGPWVKVPLDHADRYFRRVVTAVWDGQRVHVAAVDDPLVFIHWAGPLAWGTSHGLQGSQHEGWQGWAPIDELTDVHVEERDYPLEPHEQETPR